jgi:predicted outer membrane repeat protein
VSIKVSGEREKKRLLYKLVLDLNNRLIEDLSESLDRGALFQRYPSNDVICLALCVGNVVVCDSIFYGMSSLFFVVTVCIKYAFSDIIYVDSNSSSLAANCGSDITTACPTILDAFNNARSLDTIQLLPGYYTGPGNENLTTGKYLATKVQLIGTSNVLIECGGPNRFIHVENTFLSVFSNFVVKNCSAVIKTDLILANCTNSGTNCIVAYGGAGGALFLEGNSKSVTISNMQFLNNSAVTGGAIYVVEGSLNLTNVLFVDNQASVFGGALASDTSGITLTNCTFRSNTVTSILWSQNFADIGSGGALYAVGGSRMKITRTDFQSNTALIAGGAIVARLVSGMDVDSSTFRDNMATGWENCRTEVGCLIKGGALTVIDVAVNLLNCTLHGNIATTQDLSQVCNYPIT